MAYLTVDVMGTAAGGYLEIDVNGGNGDPIPMVRAQFDTWRAAHPCPSAPDMSAPGDDLSSAGDGGTTTGGPGCSCSFTHTAASAFTLTLALAVALALAMRLSRRR
jgi:hypothetical protein